ncbi:hypothetical protein ABL78_0642 [Leptomonas seymouri]|uniref:Sfi1 spindle body domain-containing protein n=1 Tax=Leptomonas seymouri TaxID=5684 RepID=A0A0N1IA04_LEPSE|nr:hypothetical protein ABL78_0642 [Leptomonas seymouri]|eukprot:KPI90260.1 hypothetical protein ABL78_0642 [Leptomonas seymouri]
MPLVRRSSLDRFASQDGPAYDDLMNQVQDLSSSALLASSPSAEVTLLVKGTPLKTVIQVLADAVLHQQVQLRRGREAAEAQARQADALHADHRDTLGRVKNDLELSRRPFSLACASLLPDGSGQPTKAAHRRTSTDTLAEAVRLTHQQLQQLRFLWLCTSAGNLATKRRQENLSNCFLPWALRSARRVKAKELEAAACRNLLATYYARWRRRAACEWRQRQLRRERHLRAVTRRSQKATLTVYMRKWEAFASAPAAQVTQLRTYQRRVAHAWSVSGPAVTTCLRAFFQRWRQWTSVQGAEKDVLFTSVAQEAKNRQLLLLKSIFTSWQKTTQQRRLSRVCHRLSRVMATQNLTSLVRYYFHRWVSCADDAQRRRRLEVLAADQHKRRVTAIARRYFNELRLYRREQQYQRMMRSVETSLLALANRISSVEDLMLAQNKSIIAAPRDNELPVSHLCPLQHFLGERDTPYVQWNPATDEELRIRVEELLSRSR